MARKIQRVAVRLNKGNIQKLPFGEIKVILRGADELIAEGGRTLLVQILKGAKRKKIFELALDKCPSYGYFHSLQEERILEKIDWMIINGYLQIEYNHRLPLLCFTHVGWEIEKEIRVDEFIAGFDAMIEQGKQEYSMEYLKDRNRDMIMVLIEKIKATKNKKYCEILKAWHAIECKNVRQRIEDVMDFLGNQ